MHIALNRIFYVQDVDRLATFYRDAFGLSVVEEIKGDWAVLDVGPCQLALHRVGKAYWVADPASWESKAMPNWS
jgi:catechol 2,3-dioxygenase-like lactoylglutathione lyase family enzyme